MQEESTQRTVALVIRAALLTEIALKRALIAYLRFKDQARYGNIPEQHGKMTVRELMQKDQGANTMDINNGNIREFDKVAAKYNIDYAVKKEVTDDATKYIVFFKGRDADVMAAAFREFCNLTEEKGKNGKEKAKEHKEKRPSVREKLKRGRDKETIMPVAEKIKEKVLNKEKEAVL